MFAACPTALVGTKEKEKEQEQEQEQGQEAAGSWQQMMKRVPLETERESPTETSLEWTP